MKIKSYLKGRRFEYEVKKILEAKGYYVIRSAKSGTLFDLIAFNDKEILLIQCKISDKIYPYLIENYREEVLKIKFPENAKILLAVKEKPAKKTKGVISLIDIKKEKEVI